jgi:hypothetical protein
MEELRAKLRTYEAQNRGQTDIDISNNASKNETPAQRETGQNPSSEMQDMRNYLAEVMAVIKGYDNKLSTQQGRQPTPSDRS